MERFVEIPEYVPTVNEILSSAFSEYRFLLGDEIVTPGEVFENDGFFSLVAKESVKRLVAIGFHEIDVSFISDDHSLAGETAFVSVENPSELILFSLQSIVVSKDLFGESPEHPVALDFVVFSNRHIN